MKLKIYNNIYEFNDDVIKMLKFCIESMNRVNRKTNYLLLLFIYNIYNEFNINLLCILFLFKDSKNSSFCKLMEIRLQKQIKKLKEENKI